MNRSHRLARLAAAALAAVALSGSALAQEYPTRPIRMVIAFPAGGPTDFVGRLLAEKMKELLGQSVIIENRAGANGAIGADFVAKSEPDGHTLFLTTVGAVAITPGMRNDLPYDTMRDFAPISLVVRNTTILVVRPDPALKSAKELAALAKAKPEQIPFASTGVGSMPHLALELFQSAGNIKFLHVPYRGAAPARDRSHRRTGAGAVRRRAGAAAADRRRQAQAARRCRRGAQSEAAERADAGGARLPGHAGGQLVRAPRPGPHAAGA